MKSCTILFLLMLFISLLSGIEPFLFKGSGSFGLVNGTTLGIGWKNGEKPKREHFVNAIYYATDVFWYAGINHEHRLYHSSNFYTLLTTGLDYVEVDNMGSIGGSNAGDSDKPGSALIPHITVGLGYQTNLAKDIHLFIEWDIGIKASISNINIGLTF
ncbi:MAG: hypothetical protein RBQ87_03690 [Candidatus Cloacimonadaceae bacterium]|nr:hypothetical protein [Candidatus Cloacimonadaceae bacterium]